MDSERLNAYGGERISKRQIDELIGIARGLAADGVLNQPEVEFLQKWLAANLGISDVPLVSTLYQRVTTILSDGVADVEECAELLETLNSLGSTKLELGEMLASSNLPLCAPAPDISFSNSRFCFTGTFTFGSRKECEQAVTDRGGDVGSLTQKTDVLVIGAYATESWKFSSFGTKILKACNYRDQGVPISIVAETHWRSHL